MQKWFATYFGFSRRELNGICALAFVLLLLWGVPHIFSFRDDSSGERLSVQVAEIERFLATVNERQPYRNNSERQAADSRKIDAEEVAYFKFDPNGLAVVDWKRLGLSERQIRTIKNYEAKGGRFRKKEDLQKIYAINDVDYARLAPYIEIEPAEPDAIGVGTTRKAEDRSLAMLPKEEQLLHLDLNGADSLELQYLPGIGPVFASRIVRFRERLGGFHHISQLMDVYGFDSVRFEGLKHHVYVDSAKVKKIALNTADYHLFRDHPFLDHKLANAIVQYRKQHGPYRSISDLLNIAIMDEGIFRKIVPYLTLAND